MKNLFIRTKEKSSMWLGIYFIIILMPMMLFSSQLDESLVDDVTAMITNAKQMAHTIFLLDTSEGMNAFAYSDYINTCADARSNISYAKTLCSNAFNQCRNVEANAMCDVDLGCDDIATKCDELDVTESEINNKCTRIETLYAEPSPKNLTIADPLNSTGTNDAKKFVGPWNPDDNTYQDDICFYNWTEDTEGDVLNEYDTSGHYTNPDNGTNTDRRDWDCITDGVKSIKDIYGVDSFGGTWLNWKYATSLDAIKIIVGDVHDFSYPPRSRGDRECNKIEYKPYKEDTVLGKICYKEFDPDIDDPNTFNTVKTYVRDNWTAVSSTANASDCISSDTFAAVDPVPDPSVAVAVPCDVCRNYDGSEVPCTEYAGSSSNSPTNINGITATVQYSCCVNYECTNPKCRDDDTSCRDDGGSCTLGYYSDFDQDQNHCCDMLNCVEPDSSGCPDGGTYLPGPGNDTTVQFESGLGMPVLSGTEEYQNVTLVAYVTKLNFSLPKENVSKVVVSIYYGCNVSGDTLANKVAEKTYTAEVSSMDAVISAPVNLTSCEQSGYKVGGTMQVFHSGANFSAATATMNMTFSVTYDSGADQSISILDPSKAYYSEYKSITTGSATEVYEYECRTAFYHKQSYVQSGGPSNCDWTKITPKPDRCTEPDHTVIDQDQWYNPKKTACTWLCRDKVTYDDVWKCRAFFSQMDNIEKNGPEICADRCYDTTESLESCCSCVSTYNNLYNYSSLEPVETVKFSSGGPSYKCATSGYEEGITSDGKRTYISGFMAEVTTGHIKEVGDASYQLNIAGYVSPYASNKWYSSASLINKSSSFLKSSFVSLFETGKTGTRDVACIYDLLNNFEGTDCDDGCGVSSACGCTVDLNGGTNYCDYPNFWMKIPNTQGGRLIFPAKSLSGTEITNFKNIIKNLKAKGGSTLGETLYDVWRYLGGMYSVYDPGYLYNLSDPSNPGSPYTSPYQSADVQCFSNTAVVISGGQPQFDDNYAISGKTTQVAPSDAPWVKPTESVATSDKPYITKDWYLTAFEKVANWVHTKDFYHSSNPDGVGLDDCALDYNVNIYGYEVGGTKGSLDCTESGDTSKLNVIQAIDTVAIGDWVLSTLYANSDTTYLKDSVLKNAAVNNGGDYYGLTAESEDAKPDLDGKIHLFSDLTDLFDAFAKSGSPSDVASGRPTWTSITQPSGANELNASGYIYLSGVIPVDNTLSRFWFGNAKKYALEDDSDDSSECLMKSETGCENSSAQSSTWYKQTAAPGDCYSEDSCTDVDNDEFKKIMCGGAATKLKDRLTSHSVPCDSTVGSESPCYTSGARNILYDDGTDMLELKTADPSWFKAKFAVAVPSITKGEAIQILDYMYGYDAFDYDNDGKKNQVRYHNDPTTTVDNPYDIKFSNSDKVTIRNMLLGGIVHSTPVSVRYDDSDTVRTFAGGNDGMLHSFDQDGNETFAYIPLPVLPSLTNFLDAKTGIFFNSSVDGPVTLFHIDTNDDGFINSDPANPTPVEKAYLIFGYRRGANYYTVVDISEMDKPKLVQNIQVEGQSWAKPLVFRKCFGTCTNESQLTYYMVLPGGYDPCFDSDSPMCNLTGGSLNPAGNEISIYKFNGTKFVLIKKYDRLTSEDSDTRDISWLKTSFVANPFAVDISEKMTVNTEFVYLNDISSTMFRIDVRNTDPNKWKFRAIFVQRTDPGTIAWGSGIRTYTGMNIYPQTIKYPSYQEKTLIPIAMGTGNMVNPQASEYDEMITIYDRYNYIMSDDPMDSNNLKTITDMDLDHGCQPWSGVNGWEVAYLKPLTEKGFSNPLLSFNYGSSGSASDNRYTLRWTTYYPNDTTSCRSFGSGRIYERTFIDGLAQDEGAADTGDSGDTGDTGDTGDSGTTINNDDYLDPVKHCNEPEPLGSPDDVVPIEFTDGTAYATSMGSTIYITSRDVVVENAVSIIKWYELY